MKREEEKNGVSRYPFILVHGVAVKDFAFFKAFGDIEGMLKQEGYLVYTAKTDGFGTIEHNAAQLKEEIKRILARTGAEKVNVIAHSKGGLDARYMIEHLQAEELVASLTTLCTPHKGAALADKILSLPAFIPAILNVVLNVTYKISGDKKPDAIAVCRQLRVLPPAETEKLHVSQKVYCQSFSSVLERDRADFVADIPLLLFKRFEKGDSDGLVSVESAQYARYRGHCLEESVSHSEIIGLMVRKKKKEKIFSFYRELCFELTELGF